MSGLEELLISNGGTLLTFAIFIGERIIQATKDRNALKQKKDQEIAQAYLEWFREQDQTSLVSRIEARHDELVSYLLENEIDLQKILQATLQLIESEAEIKTQLATLSKRIQRPVLSSIPLNCRDLTRVSLFSRDNEVAELRRTAGDLIVSGQPGSGKTFLLYNLSKDWNAKFLVSRNEGDILSYLRFSNPPVLIVDDAHDLPEILSSLIHFRQETGKSFRMIAICWPFEESDLMRIMRLSAKSIYNLGLLPANAIVQIIKNRFESAGFSNVENWLIREIRAQAAGRAGLALRLVDLILEDGTLKSLLDGQAHFELIDRAFHNIERYDTHQILAAFAVGGKTGMRKNDVSSILNIPVHQTTKILRTLATGGVIEETGQETLATIPDAFRQILLKDIFLCGGALALDDQFWNLYQRAPDKEVALLVLIASMAKGARVDRNKLLTELKSLNSIEAWVQLAWLSPDYCTIAIQECPDSIEALADPALCHVPEMAIPLLLEKAIGDKRPENAYPGAPARKLGDWLMNFSFKKGDAVKRRRLLLETTMLWLKQGGDKLVAWKILPKCVSVQYENSETDPGDGRAVTLTFGLVSIPDLKKIAEFWEAILKCAKEFPPTNWEAMKSALHEWLYPHVPNVLPPEGFNEFTKSKVKDVVHQLISFKNLPVDALTRWAIEHEIIIDKKADVEFMIFCPPDRIHPPQNWRITHKEYGDAAVALGEKWAAKDPEKIAEKLSSFECERRLFGINWPLMGYAICSALAENIDDLEAWIETFLKYDIEPDYLFPLIRQGVAQKTLSAEQWLSLTLSLEKYRWHSISEVLSNEELSRELFIKAWPYLGEYSTGLGIMALRGEIALSRLVALIEHENRGLLLEIAINDFHSDKQPFLIGDRANWVKLFRKAITGLEELDSKYFYDIEKLLENVPEIKCDLAKEILKNPTYISWVHDEPYRKLFDRIELKEKIQLLKNLENIHPTDFTSWLVGDNLSIYRALLENDRLRSHHLIPLMGKPSNPAWQIKALLALEFGFSPHQVARAALGNHRIISGSRVVYWQGWLDEYNILLNSQDSRLQEIGKLGKEIVQSYLNQEKKEESREALYGISGD